MSDCVIILFQIDKADAKQNNYSAYFNHCQVKNIHIENGRNEIFPTREWNLKIKKKEYAKMFQAYTEISRVMLECEEPYCNIQEILDAEEDEIGRPMYMINTVSRMRGVDNKKKHHKICCWLRKRYVRWDNMLLIMLGKKSFDCDIKNQKITERI